MSPRPPRKTAAAPTAAAPTAAAPTAAAPPAPPTSYGGGGGGGSPDLKKLAFWFVLIILLLAVGYTMRSCGVSSRDGEVSNLKAEKMELEKQLSQAQADAQGNLQCQTSKKSLEKQIEELSKRPESCPEPSTPASAPKPTPAPASRSIPKPKLPTTSAKPVVPLTKPAGTLSTQAVGKIIKQEQSDKCRIAALDSNHQMVGYILLDEDPAKRGKLRAAFSLTKNGPPVRAVYFGYQPTGDCRVDTAEVVRAWDKVTTALQMPVCVPAR